MWPATAALLLAIALASPADAQQRVTLRGVAWDSLRSEPLPGAMVSLVGVGRSTTADPRGRFSFDTLAPGSYTVLMSHDALDSLGLTGVSSKVNLTDGRDEIRLALPSYAAFWRNACAGRPPRDSSLVYGMVRRPGDGTPVPRAKVEVAWLDLSSKDRRSVEQKFKRVEINADSTGNFGFCGVPNGSALRIRASTESMASGTIDLLPIKEQVRWRDLTVGPVPNGDPQILGTVTGVVLRQEGVPFAGARVAVDEMSEVRTDSAGRFVIAGVPAGTRQIQVAAVGQDPISRIFDVAPRDTARLRINLDRVTTLGSVRVTGDPFSRRVLSGFADRKKAAIGTFLDSTDISKQGTLRAAFETAASLKVKQAGIRGEYNILLRDVNYSECVATVYIDAVRQSDQEPLWAMFPENIGAVEIYKRGAVVPAEYQWPRSTCGVVAVWSKRYFAK